jgi:hypothetical protein
MSKGTAWFDDFVTAIDGKDIQTMTETPKIYLKNYNTADLIQQSRSHPQH